MDTHNEQKKYVVTGVSQGIGLATTLRLASDGATIIMLAKESDDIPLITAKVKELGGTALFINTDIRSEESITSAVRQLDDFDTIDGFIHCAAVVRMSGTIDTSQSYADLMYQVNARAPLILSKALFPKLQNAQAANIIFISPPINLDPRWLGAHLSYTSSKYLCSMHVVGLSAEFESYAINVNAIWPKYSISSPDMCNMINGTYGDMNSVRRKPDIVADAVAIMLENDSVTGECLIDEQILIDAGIESFEHYECQTGNGSSAVSEFIS